VVLTDIHNCILPVGGLGEVDRLPSTELREANAFCRGKMFGLPARPASGYIGGEDRDAAGHQKQNHIAGFHAADFNQTMPSSDLGAGESCGFSIAEVG
jgi:hypothetical protein